jgi:hypothetical protein
MKTPREILLARHQAATPKLDALRHKSVEQAFSDVLSPSPPSGERVGVRGRMLQLIWQELFLPSRRIWAGLAAAWLLILAANVCLRDHSQTIVAVAVSPREMISSLHQQQQLLTELIGPNEPYLAEPQKPFVPRPGSRRSLEIMAA